MALKKYDNFRNNLDELTRSFTNFFNQMNEVLAARKNRAKIKRPHLALINLYNAAKVLPSLQAEYTALFRDYTTLGIDFDKLEAEKYLTLLNMWNYVLDLPPGGRPISYAAREKYRKGNSFVSRVIDSIKEDPEYEISFAENTIYFWKDIGKLEDYNGDRLCTEFVLHLRQKFKDAISYTSNRWYLEKEDLHFVMVMKIGGIYTPFAFKIPLYKLLDCEEEEISNYLIQEEIGQELLDIRSLTENQRIWESGLQGIASIKNILKCYNQIRDKCQEERFKETIDNYINAIEDKIRYLWNDFERCKPLLSAFAKKLSLDSCNINIVNGFVEIIPLMQNCDQLLENLKKQKDVDEIIKELDMIKTLMIIAFPHIISI